MSLRIDKHAHGLLAGVLAALAMIAPFSIDAVFPGFPGIGHAFHVDPAALQQVISLYLLAYAGASLFHGALSDTFGRKPIMVTGMCLYALASAGAALADSFTVLLIFRLLQGACAGAGMVVGRAMIRDRLQGAAAQRLMSHIMMIFAVAPAVAPVVGAWLLGLDGWRGIFWVLTGFALLMAVSVAALLPESHPPGQRTRFVPRALLAGYAEILRDRMFWPLVIASTVNFGALFLYIASAPAIVLRLLGRGPDGFPWLFVPVVAGLMTGSALSGRMAGRISALRTVGLGYAVMTSACLLHVILGASLATPALPWSMLPLTLQAIGVQMAFPTLTLLLLDRYPLRRGAVSALQAFFSLLFNALVAGMLSPLLAGGMLALGLGASAMTVLGLVPWAFYARKARLEPVVVAVS